MNNIQFDVDTHELERLNRFFTDKEWSRIRKNALNKVANLIKKDIKDVLKTELPASSHKGSKYKDTLLDAVRRSKTKEKSNEPYTKVHVLGTQSSGSGTFRTRFFESPKERYTKDHRNKNGVLIKGHSTGKLPEIHMFARGFRNAESSMLSMKAYIEEQINIINKKRMS